MRTSHTSHNHKRRKPIQGLTPDDVVKQMAEDAKHGKGVRTVRHLFEKFQKPVVSNPRSGDASSDEPARISSTAERDDAERSSDASDSPDRTQISRVLKRMLGQEPPAALLDTEDVGRLSTNAEALAAVIMREALGGKQWAVEMVRDQSEGKPVRAVQINNGDQEVEDTLDRVSKARLNQIAKGKSK